MNHVRPSLLAAGLSLCFFSASAAAVEAPGYDAAASQLLRNIPVHIVLLNDELKAQIAYNYTNLDPAYTQHLYNNPVPGMSTGAGIAAGALGSALGEAIANAAAQQAAEKAVMPAYAQLQQAQCKLPSATLLSDALERGVRASSWGTDTPLHQLTLAPSQTLDERVDGKQPRQLLLASYSMSPDFSSLITSVSLSVYSDAIAGADKNWQKRPIWSNTLLVASDQLQVPPKTERDIAESVAAEQQRYALTDAGPLIEKANKGDTRARKKAATLVKAHEQYLREAKKEKWTPAQAAARNSRYWISDGCAPLATAINNNTRELEMLLVRLYTGNLPVAALPPSRKQPAVQPEIPAQAQGTRTVTAEPGNWHVSRRVGDSVPYYYIHSWYMP